MIMQGRICKQQREWKEGEEQKVSFFSDGNGTVMETEIAMINNCLLYDSDEMVAAITCFSFYI